MEQEQDAKEGKACENVIGGRLPVSQVLSGWWPVAAPVLYPLSPDGSL